MTPTNSMQALRELYEKATKGPFSVYIEDTHGKLIPPHMSVTYNDGVDFCRFGMNDADDTDLGANVRYVAALLNSFPALAQRMEALEEVAEAAMKYRNADESEPDSPSPAWEQKVDMLAANLDKALSALDARRTLEKLGGKWE